MADCIRVAYPIRSRHLHQYTSRILHVFYFLNIGHGNLKRFNKILYLSIDLTMNEGDSNFNRTTSKNTPF